MGLHPAMLAATMHGNLEVDVTLAPSFRASEAGVPKSRFERALTVSAYKLLLSVICTSEN